MVDTLPRPMRPRPPAGPHARAKRSLGQHFLRDRATALRIVDALELGPGDRVVEIGPGRGALTSLLAARAGCVTAVEKDDDLAAAMTGRFAADPAVTVLNADALTVEMSRIAPGGAPHKLVGNLPYNVASPIIRRFLSSPRRPSVMVVMVQREVADAMTAAPGKMTYLSVEVQLRAEARRLLSVPPSAFRPRPKVTSSVVVLTPRPEPVPRVGSEERFLALVRAGFSARRKQLRNSLGAGLGMDAGAAGDLLGAAGIDGRRRPQTLSMAEWGALYEAREGTAR